MEVDFAFLADGAEAVNGKVYVVGGAFDTIWAKETPVTYSKLSFVLRFIFDAAEVERKHKLEIILMHEDGENVAKVGGALHIKRDSQLYKGWRHSFLTVMNFVNLVFPKFGDYSFHIVFNNNTVKAIPVRVAQSTDMNASQTSPQ